MAKFYLNKVLEQRGVTQYNLSQLLGVSTGVVSRWCSEGYNPTLKTLNKLAKALGVRIADLMEPEVTDSERVHPLKVQQSVLEAHRKKGKKFIPPLIDKLDLSFIGWVHNILPELVWLAIVEKQLGFHRSAEIAAEFAKIGQSFPSDRRWIACLSSFAHLQEQSKEALLHGLTDAGVISDLRYALGDFYYYYPKLPLDFLLGDVPKEQEEKKFLDQYKGWLSDLFDKTSITATRMLANAVYMDFVCGRLKVFKGLSLARFPEIQDYPNTDIAKQIASSLRAMINTSVSHELGKLKDTIWSSYFWRRGFEIEPVDFSHLKGVDQ